MIVTPYVKLQIMIVAYAICASPEGRFGSDLRLLNTRLSCIQENVRCIYNYHHAIYHISEIYEQPDEQMLVRPALGGD
jgi:hypothetical protein